MEDELILKQPSDRRLGDNNALPPGPPGAEFDTVDFDTKNAPKPPLIEKEVAAPERSSRRRSPSGSPPPPPRKRKSPSRTRRSPSPPARGRSRRSPSPRRNRYRDYSPDRRPRYGGRRSPERRRSPPRRVGGRDRYRGRGRSSSRSLSRSPTPHRRSGGSARWSPKKKPNTPPQQQPSTLPRQLSQPPPSANQPPPQYGVMAPPPPQIYGEAYGPPPGYNQYGVPPPQTGFVPPNDAYAAMQAQGGAFNTAYPPPGAWGVDAYSQQQWMPPPTQMQQMPPPQQQQPPPLVVQPTTQQQVATNVPPPVATAPTTSNKHTKIISEEVPNNLESNPQHDAVAQEAENQRDELKKQRTSYLKKTAVLKKELKMLKEQRKDLHSGGAPASPTTKGFIDENEKLQNQIQKKLSTIENVIDMLTGIIGEENLDKDDDQLEDDDLLKEVALSSLQKTTGSERTASQLAATTATPKKKPRSSSSSSESSSGSSSSSSSDSSSSSETEQTANKEDEDDDSSPERLKKKVIESMKNKDKDLARTKQDTKGPNKKERFNYVFYDPEMHWCQTCNVFPKTAKDYLNHLHTKNHMDRESIETPWHTDMITDQFPAYENAPTKRTPIRGLTFFVPATAWFCKLCNIWMGDLHCASTHLKSQLHANRYNAFLEENPHYEVNWLADRQIVLNEQKSTPLPQQITSVSTTAAERKKTKKEEEKVKKRKKKSDKKQKKKKRKSNKKRKKDSDSTSSSSSDSSSSTDSDEPKKKKILPVEVKDLDNPNPAVSIRLSMRKQEIVKNDDELPPPPPQLKLKQPSPTPQPPPAGGKWMVVQEGVRNKDGEKDADDSIIQQWNTVQPVISESEKRLLEQLKGKLKNKSKDEQQSKSSATQRVENEKENKERDRDRDREHDKERGGGEGRSDRSDRRDRDRDRDGGVKRGGREDRDRRPSRRSRTRSATRSRSRGRDYRRNVRRSRSRSRGRMSPRGWRNRNRRNDRSRSRSLRRRSRSPYDRRRRSTRSRSRSASRGGVSSRVEKPVVRPAEFRPRVPEKDKEKDKKSTESKEKKDKNKPKTTSSTAATTAASTTGKKLPFIGKMPVFKKQASGTPGEMGEKSTDLQAQQGQPAGTFIYTMDPASAFGRPPAPTAAQIQMAMMEDAYGNAPPFHPDAGMMVDYDDLMPDPVQFVNIMGQAPPPPPPQAAEDDKDMLPPGIDVEESEECVPKPITEGPPPGKGPLPKDLEDALNIIFPGEKKPGDNSDNEESELAKTKAKGETQIINDEAVMQPEELAKEGIHLVTFEETSQLGLDEASQLSMNEPLVFNRPPSNPTTTAVIASTDMEIEDANSQHDLDLNLDIVPPPPPEVEVKDEHENSPRQIDMTPQETVISPPSPQNKISVEEQKTEILEDNNMIDIPIPSEINNATDIPIPSEINNATDIPIPSEINNATEIESIPQEAEPQKELLSTELMQSNTDIDLADIPQPPPSPTESEKNRRQEELDDLAMLGIDADDMAAQCIE